MINANAANEMLSKTLSQLVTRILGSMSGRTIQSMMIDPIMGTLTVNYTNGTSDDLGRIVGNNGTPGVGVLDLQLYPDPASPKDVYLQTTLTNGIVLRTTESLKGWHGKGLDSVYILDNHIHFVLDDAEGTELTPIPVTGLTAISINGASVVEGDLVFTLTNGTSLNVGTADALAGKGINSLEIEEKHLKITYTDNPTDVIDLGQVVGNSVTGTKVVEGNLIFTLDNGTELDAGSAAALAGVGVDEVKMEGGKLLIKYSNNPEFVDLGSVDGIESLAVVDGKLVYRKSSAPTEDIILSEYKYFTGMEVVDNELFALTNQPAPNDRINLGPVSNLKGEQGVGIQAAALANNTLTLTLTNAETLDIPISGLDPVAIVGARYDAVANEVFFILENGTEISSGIKEDLRGAGVDKFEVLPTGEVNVFYDTAPEVGVTLATIKYISDFYVEAGKIYVKYNTAPDTAIELGTILGVAEIVTTNGVITVRYTDGSTSSLGTVRGISSLTIDNAFNLVVTYTDDTTSNLGSIRGGKGEDGVSVVGATVDGNGDLIVAKSNGENINAGQVRADIDNIIGSVKRFTATVGQDEYIVAHTGEAAVFINGELVENSLLDLSAGDRIRFVTPLTGGEKVVVMAFAPTGSVITGKGIANLVEVSPGVYELTLENDTKLTIDTVTPFDTSILPPQITGIVIDQTSHLLFTFSDGTVIDAGFTANANSIKTATVNPEGRLILTMSDDTLIDCGSVMSNLAISNAVIDENGHLIITMNSGGVFDAGITGAYVTTAEIDSADGHLRLTLNTGTVVDAGAVVNPLLGTFHDFTAFEGQTEFVVSHASHRVLFFANGIMLNEARLDLTDPYKVKVLTPRKDLDVIRIVLLSTGGVFVKGLESEAQATEQTFYGKVDGVVGFHPVGVMKVATPLDFVARAGQTAFNNIPHTGLVEIFVDGSLVTTGYQLPTQKVIFDNPMQGGEKVRINSLSAPTPLGSFIKTNFCRVANRTYQNGGTFSAKRWQTRQLNILEGNAIGALLDKNNIILPAGTYYVRGWASSYNVAANALQLYAVNSQTTLLTSEVQYSEAASKTTIEGYFTISAQSALTLRHYGLRSVGTWGLGKCGDGSSTATTAQTAMGIPMTHCELNLWKVD